MQRTLAKRRMKSCWLVMSLCVVGFALVAPVHGADDQPAEATSARPAQLPSGPAGPGRFGAYYTHLKYEAEWDKPWRVGGHADVVVRFADGGHKLVFWRGTSYIPCWVTANGIWYTNEFVERRGAHSPNTEGCVEPMSDKQTRLSHVRVIESNDARVVIHWRYAPVDVRYEHPFIDPLSGWSDWVDEYYTIYPDATGVRAITIHTTRPDRWTEFHEAIVVNQPGTMPDDNIELGAISLANMNGESRTYYWTDDGGPGFDDGPARANILTVNLKAKRRPFAIAAPAEEEGVLITPYKGHGLNSHFNFWDHWPVAQVASDGRRATSADRPSHSSLCHIGLPGKATVEWKPYAQGENWRTKIMLHGMTDKPVAGLVPMAKSWLSAPEITDLSGGYRSSGYDPTQRAYVLECEDVGQPAALQFELRASKDSPAVDPALVVAGWGKAGATVSLGGKPLTQGKDFRVGHRAGEETTDLVVWINTELTRPVVIALAPSTN